MTEKEIRWGILGAAKIAETAVGPAMVRTPRSRVLAVGGRRRDAAQRLADQLGAERVYDGYERVLADDEVNAVYVALPNTLHAEWVVAALEAGKHVLCEKPMGTDGDEVRRMLHAAENSGRVLMEGFMWRHHPRVERVIELIDAGALGDVRLIRATYTFDLGAVKDVRSGRLEDDIRLDPTLGGGALNDLGTYCAHGMRTYARSRPVSVVSSATHGPGRAVETSVSGEVRFANGIVGQFFASVEAGGGGRIEILGTTGRILLANAFRTRIAQGANVIEIETEQGRTEERYEFVDQYDLEIAGFTSTVLDGARPAVTLEDSLENAVLLAAIRRSWTDGTVHIPEPESVRP